MVDLQSSLLKTIFHDKYSINMCGLVLNDLALIEER